MREIIQRRPPRRLRRDKPATILRSAATPAPCARDGGGLPEAAAFTPDGRYLLVGNYLDQDISISFRHAATSTEPRGPPAVTVQDALMTVVNALTIRISNFRGH